MEVRIMSKKKIVALLMLTMLIIGSVIVITTNIQANQQALSCADYLGNCHIWCARNAMNLEQYNNCGHQCTINYAKCEHLIWNENR